MAIVLDGTSGITSPALTGLTTPLSVAQGGTGSNTNQGLQVVGNPNEYNANTTLPSSVYGQLVTSNTVTATTLTLPSPTGNSGKVISIYNINSGIVTVASNNGTANLFILNGTPVTSILLGGSQGIQLTNDGTNWKPLTGFTGGLGIGQTWTDVTASRALATTYTNSTGKAIEISLQGNRAGVSTATLSISINGAPAFIFAVNTNSGGGNACAGSLIIPNLNTYNVTSPDATIVTWHELR